MAKGVTCGQCGASAAARAGGVGTQLPGSVEGVYSTTLVMPSVFRQLIIWSATCCPRAMPSCLALPSGIFARDDCNAWADFPGWGGLGVAGVGWAAAAVAASC